MFIFGKKWVNFNSYMVRLRVVHNQKDMIYATFQFLHGAIKGFCAKTWSEPTFNHFNSYMVRLRAGISTPPLHLNSFQFLHGAIKGF